VERPFVQKWQGPDPVLIWGKGHACIYDSRAQNARWLPERLIKPYNCPGKKNPEELSKCASLQKTESASKEATPDHRDLAVSLPDEKQIASGRPS
jgi:hypothetical protein